MSFTAAGTIPAGSYVTFVNGLTITSVKGTVKGTSKSTSQVVNVTDRLPGSDISAKIPAGLAGQTYVFVTKSDVETTFSDSAVLFGPAIIEVLPAPPAINYNLLKN